MKKFVLLLFFLFTLQVFAVEQQAVYQPITTPQNIMFDNCTKIFATDKTKLFYLTLASISANKFSIDEIQTSNGYIIFTANRNKYLASVGKIDNTN